MNESLSSFVSNLISAIDLKLLFLLMVIGVLLIFFGAYFVDLGSPFGVILLLLGAVVLGISIRVFWAGEKPLEANSKHIHYKSSAREKSRIKCSYCRRLYDETNEYCPYCGGTR
jgi:uncharacterized membrane protein YfcA